MRGEGVTSESGKANFLREVKFSHGTHFCRGLLNELRWEKDGGGEGEIP